MALLRHELSYRKTNIYAIAVCQCEGFLKAFHGAPLVSDGVQGLSREYQYLALFRFRTHSRIWRWLSVFLCELHVSKCLIPILQVRKRAGKQCINAGVVRGEFLCD